MNIPRYLIPMTTAAALHVALFYFFSDRQPAPFRTILTPFELTPLPPSINEPTPPEETDYGQQVTRLGDPRPEIPDESRSEPAKCLLFEMPKPAVPAPTPEKILSIPSTSGDRNGSPDGTDALLHPTALDPRLLDHPPHAKVQMPPEYPSAMRQGGISGRVLVAFEVDKSGRVVRAFVLSSTHREFESAALRAVMQWRFEPGRRNNVVVPFRMTIPIDFSLDRT